MIRPSTDSSDDELPRSKFEPTHNHSHLLALLAFAQARNLDFLPIRWQEALGSIGEGGSATITQRLVTLRTSMAFKRLKSSLIPKADEQKAFKSLMSEIAILTTPSIRNLPYIVNIEAVCWDISESEERVWPVLVFDKATDGNLQNFLISPEGCATDILERLGWCGQVAEALCVLHANGLPLT
jgi:Protein tyrosine and serine/threonine kinase